MSADSFDLNSLKIDRHSPEPSRGGGRNFLRIALTLLILGGILFAGYKFAPMFRSSQEVQIGFVGKTFPAQAGAVLTASGYIVPQRQAAVASKGTGQLLKLNVTEGDRVVKNQIIAKLDSQDIEARLRQNEANLVASQAQVGVEQAELARSEREFQRQQALSEQRLNTGSDLDLARANYDSAKARLAVAKANIQSYQRAIETLQVELENTTVRAPFDGTVLSKNADVGEMVAPFAGASNSRGAVVTIADMSSLVLEADVSESYIERVSMEQSCEIVLDAFPDHHYRGQVWKIVPTANRSKATILIKIRFLDMDSRVLPEMSAKVYFQSGDGQTPAVSTAGGEAKVTVPAGAVFQAGGSNRVWVVENGAVYSRPIELGERINDLLEVKSGVDVGAKVVISPPDGLKEGQKVKVLE